MLAKIGLSLGLVFGLLGVYALWFALALSVAPMVDGFIWLVESKNIYLVLIAAWFVYMGVSALRD